MGNTHFLLRVICLMLVVALAACANPTQAEQVRMLKTLLPEFEEPVVTRTPGPAEDDPGGLRPDLTPIAETALAQPTTGPLIPLTGGEVATLRVFSPPGPLYEMLSYMAQQYEAQNPGVDVEVISEPEGEIQAGDDQPTAEPAQAFQPDLAAGTLSSRLSRAAREGELSALEEMPGAPELFQRIDPKALREIEGHQYYVPLAADVIMMIYNRELFAAAGLDPNQPPRTWGEYLQAAQSIQSLPEQNGKPVYGTKFWNEALSGESWYWNLLQPFYLTGNQNQCQLLDPAEESVIFDQQQCQMEAFLTFARQAQEYASPGMEQDFFSRTVGMWPQYSYSWQPSLAMAAGEPMEMGEDVSVAPVPSPNPGDQSYNTYTVRPLVILRSTPEQEALAWEFVQFLMRDENNLEILQELSYLPTLQSLKSHAYFRDPSRQPFIQAVEGAVLPQFSENAGAAARAVLDAYRQSVIENSLTPAEAVRIAAQQARQAITP